MRAFKAGRGVGVAACVAMSLLLLMASGATATQPKCLVVNLRSGQSFRTLQEAVDAASKGDELTVKGTCLGDTQVGKSLTIVGQSNPGFGPATLNGGVFVCTHYGVASFRCGGLGYGEGVELAISRLAITGNFGNLRPPGFGALSSVTLSNSTVAGGLSDFHGGVIVSNSTIIGGVDDDGGDVTISNSTITGGTAAGGSFGECAIEAKNTGSQGGVSIFEFGVVTLNSSTVIGNTAKFGGGIFNVFGSVTLNNSTVTENSAEQGGGIYASGPVTLNNSTVAGNTAEQGGGIYASRPVSLNNSTVTGNTANYGGGVYNRSLLTLNGSSSVSGNTASVHGGGIYNKTPCGATISYGLGWNGTVSGNIPDDIFSE
jgi:predicted outer membrane repeat protein